MSLLPDRMKTVKVVVPVDYQRNLLRYLSTTENIDIIDVQKKPFDINSFESGDKIRKLKDEFDKIVDHFELEEKVSKREALKIDEKNLGIVLKEIDKLSNSVIKDLKQIDDRIILAEQELEKNISVIEIANNLIPFGISFQDLDDESTIFQVVVGRMNSKRIPRFKWNLDAVTDGNYIFKETGSDKNNSFIAIGFLERYQDELNRLLVAYGFEKYSIPERITGDPLKVAEGSKQKITNLEKKITELKEEAEVIVKEHGSTILAFAEQLDIEENYLKIANMMRITKKNISIWGWVPQKKAKNFEKNVIKLTENNALVEFTKPVFEESEYPTKTSVPKFLRVYDGLISAYGVPGYNEYNTAIIMQIFFPIMFGIMFADVGHGFLFTLVGIYGLTLRNKKFDVSNFMGELKNYFKNGHMLIIVSGIASMIFGVIFGSYFGVTSHYALWKPAGGDLNNAITLPSALWFSPESADLYNGASTVILMLELSLVIGMIHMSVGYVLRFIQNIKHKHYTEAFLVTTMWAVFNWGLFILVFTFGTNFMTWFSADNIGTFDMALFSINGQPIPLLLKNVPALWIFLGLLVVPMVVMSIYLFTHGMDGFGELLEILLSTLSHTVSYARIFAMNAVHGALSHIFLLTDFVDSSGGFTTEQLHDAHLEGVLGIVNYLSAVIIGGIVILALEGLFSFIQTLRLNWVEFFSKVGYQGQGTKYESMAKERIYSKVK